MTDMTYSYPEYDRDDNFQTGMVPGGTEDGGWQRAAETPPPEYAAPAYWDGSCYRSGPIPSSIWNQSSPAGSRTPQRKKNRGGRRIFLKIVAAAAACLLVSAGSIGAFVAMINSGIIQVQNTGGDSLFTIQSHNGTVQKVVNANAQELTPQEVAKKVKPSVVCILNYQNQGGYGSSVEPAGEGSGIIATADGMIITNAHVVSGASSLQVVLEDGTKYEARLVGSDTLSDLALIKIDATGLTPAEFGSSGDLEVADWVMAVGNPGGMAFQSSVTIGYVSALDREVTNTNGYTMTYIQTDAAINPGNSGGALVNAYGQVIGINTAKISATEYEGLGFAIPIDLAQPVINDLRDVGYVKDRAALGLSGSYIDGMTARFYGLSQGLYVESITNSALRSAGLQEGDVITAIDGEAVTSTAAVNAAVAARKPGDTVILTVKRGRSGQSFTVAAVLIQATGTEQTG